MRTRWLLAGIVVATFAPSLALAKPHELKAAVKKWARSVTRGSAAEVAEHYGEARTLGAKVGVVNGTYKFIVRTKDGNVVKKIPARYSFTLKKSGSAWKIVDHHSSEIPRTK